MLIILTGTTKDCRSDLRFYKADIYRLFEVLIFLKYSRSYEIVFYALFLHGHFSFNTALSRSSLYTVSFRKLVFRISVLSWPNQDIKICTHHAM